MNYIQNIFKSKPPTNKSFIATLQSLLGFNPKKKHYYERALTHRSANEKDEFGNPFNYERLELIGDAVLSVVIAKHLYIAVPEANEGYLTQMRAKIVSREYLNQIGKDFGLIELMKTHLDASNFSENTHGNLLEALIGAIFLDKGYTVCEKFIHKSIITPHVDLQKLEGKITSHKSLLIEWCQKQKKTMQFITEKDTGIEKVKHISVHLKIDNTVVAKARATSRKKAEEKASRRAYFALQNQIKP